ncbi:MAG: YncE family protein [Gemmatimonadota bacterium]
MMEWPFRPLVVATIALTVGCGACSSLPEGATPAPPEATYWVYVGAESEDLVHRLRFGPGGFEVEHTTHIGRLPGETEGPHGLAVSPDGRHLFMTTGHGVPDGHFWKLEIGPDAPSAEPILLGRFPATLDITPDGLYAFVVNFDLHGAMVPSTMSVVYTPRVVEVEQIELCVMPHGVRMHPSGLHAYTVCMMDDQLVEVDTRTFEVSRRFSVAQGREGPLVTDLAGDRHTGEPGHAGQEPAPMEGSHSATCSPTWAVPHPDGSRIYVACNVSDEILEVSTDGWELVRRLPSGRGPYNLAVTGDGRLLVATLKQGDAVEFFALGSGESLGRNPTSTRVVHGVTISPDDRYAFVTVEGIGTEPGKVDVFDLATLERVASAEVGQQASGIDFHRMEAEAGR